MMEAPNIYLAVDEDDFEMIFTHPPKRFFGSMNKNFWGVNDYCDAAIITIPPGTIEKLIGRKLTWEDEPIKLDEI